MSSDVLQIPRIEELKRMARESLVPLAKDSFEFNRHMRNLLGRIVVFPHRLCDGGHIVLRGRFRLRLGNSIGDPRVREALQLPLERLITVDLFKRPEREAFRERIVRMRESINEKTGKNYTETEIARHFGITTTAAQRAAALQRRTIALGIADPYIAITEPPEDYTKLRRHKNPRYRFEPLDGARLV